MDTTVAAIDAITGKSSKIMFKEVGFRSTEGGFIDPFDYETKGGTYNEMHQAAAFTALFQSFWKSGFTWFQGGSFWDVGVDPSQT